MSDDPLGWKELARIALLGTERQAAPALDDPDRGTPLGRALAGLRDQAPEARVLGAAALLSAYRRAGWRPPRDARPLPTADAAPEGERCPPPAGGLLRQLVSESDVTLVGEWLEMAGRRRVVPPAELLPPLLDLGARHASLQERIAAAVGPRGRWLAAQRDDWAYAAEVADPAALWQTATREVRQRLLRRLRATDPAAARELLRSTWGEEAPRDRAALLEALAVRLADADEPFLEAALDDRRKEVRESAARLLARLPASRLVARMKERLEPRVELVAPAGLLARLAGGGPQIRVELPAACDAAMRRDGVEPKPAPGFGERAWWMVQMLSATPPGFWSERWGLDPERCIRAARGGEDARPLLEGWGAAAVAFRDAAWAEVLLRQGTAGDRQRAVELAGTLPPGRIEALVMEELPAGRLQSGAPALPYLEAHTAPWSPELTRAVLERLVPEALASDWELREALRTYAPHMDPEAAVELLRRRGDPHAGFWVELLHLRFTLHEAFRS